MQFPLAAEAMTDLMYVVCAKNACCVLKMCSLINVCLMFIYHRPPQIESGFCMLTPNQKSMQTYKVTDTHCMNNYEIV